MYLLVTLFGSSMTTTNLSRIPNLTGECNSDGLILLCPFLFISQNRFIEKPSLINCFVTQGTVLQRRQK